MIKVRIFRDDAGRMYKFTISGHANFDEYGKDIVCSAVSVLGYTALRSLVDVCGLSENEIVYNTDDHKGYLDVKILILPEDRRYKDTQLVFKVFITGIKSIIESYPEYVIIDDRGGVLNA